MEYYDTGERNPAKVASTVLKFKQDLQNKFVRSVPNTREINKKLMNLIIPSVSGASGHGGFLGSKVPFTKLQSGHSERVSREGLYPCMAG